MLNKEMIEEIQELKARGYKVAEIADYLDAKMGKAPSLPTIYKYYNMDAVPDSHGSLLVKDKAFDHEPLRNTIIEAVKNNPDCCISSVFDLLTERFVDGGIMESLPGNEQTLRNYVRFLKKNGIVETQERPRRIYDHVFDTPPGQQMLIDFGQEQVTASTVIHFICLLLRYSRKLIVIAQDHRFSAEEACRAIYHSFVRLGGRIEQLVIDQDAVFVATETYGDVITTRVFQEFLAEQDLRLWVCNKADPESKGPIENAVGFVKKNYFSARTITCIEDVWRTLPGWQRRKDARIHQATFRIPEEVFAGIEKAHLRPMVPSVYEDSPQSYTTVKVTSMPYVQYRSSKYSVPRSLCFKQVCYKAIGDKLYLYDSYRIHICTHVLNECKGSYNQLPEHAKEPSDNWVVVMEALRDKWMCYDFQHFINGFKKENPRHLYKQLKAVSDYLDSECPTKGLVAEAMGICCRDFRYKFNQFKCVFELCRAGHTAPNVIAMSDVQRQDLDVYQKAFDERCAM